MKCNLGHAKTYVRNSGSHEGFVWDNTQHMDPLESFSPQSDPYNLYKWSYKWGYFTPQLVELLHPLLIAGDGAHLASSGSATPLGPSAEPLCLIGCLPSSQVIAATDESPALLFTFSKSSRNFEKTQKTWI